MGIIRRGSIYYYIERFTDETAALLGVKKSIWTSLHTDNMAEAEQIVRDKGYALKHKQRMYASKLSKSGFEIREKFDRWFKKDGLYEINDFKIMIMGDSMTVFRKDGSILNKTGNRHFKSLSTLLGLYQDTEHGREHDPDVSKYWKSTLSQKAASAHEFNSKILTNWYQTKEISPRFRDDANNVLKQFQDMYPDLKISETPRHVAKEFMLHLSNSFSNTTVNKKIGFFRAAVNVAIDDEMCSRNPWIKLTKKDKTGIKRLPFDDSDILVIHSKMSILSDADQLLLNLLIKTGMRLDEAYSITETYTEGNLHYFIIGSKTKSSLRRVPLPEGFPLINGVYQTGGVMAAGKRLRAFLKNKCKIDDPRKVTHSFRHRANDRLRILGAPDALRYQLLGHSDQTISKSYGEGFPVSLLKQYVDQI
jgi:integrase